MTQADIGGIEIPQRSGLRLPYCTTLFRGLSSGDHEFDDDASIQGLMVCVDGRNLDLVRSWRKTSDNDRPAAGFGPDPRRAINRHMAARMAIADVRLCEPCSTPRRLWCVPICSERLRQL